MIILLIVFLVLNLAMIAISIPLILRQVGPNLFYGFRVRRTLENRQLWFDVNKYFARRLLMTSIVDALMCVAAYAIPGIPLELYALSVLAVFAIAFGLAMSQTFRYMNSRSKKESMQ